MRDITLFPTCLSIYPIYISIYPLYLYYTINLLFIIFSTSTSFSHLCLPSFPFFYYLLATIILSNTNRQLSTSDISYISVYESFLNSFYSFYYQLATIYHPNYSTFLKVYLSQHQTHSFHCFYFPIGNYIFSPLTLLVSD